MHENSLRVLLVPDSTYWVLGTIAKSIVRFNPSVEAAIVSGPVMDKLFGERPDLMRSFDLVHFLCPYVSKEWLPRLRDAVPCVTSHHHVTDWNLIKHNLEGDAVVAGSLEWWEDAIARGAAAENVFCVPYGVDAEQFKAPDGESRRRIRSKLGVKEGYTVVGFFAKKSSNDDDRKGTDVFIEALNALREKVPNLTALIVGPGWQEMVGAFRSSGINCIWFPFIRDYKGLAEMYAALDFYWVTSRVEGGPVTLLEAMSSEVCSVTTPVGLARDIVSDGVNAALVPFNDVNGFVERTVELARDKALRRKMGQSARATILERMHVGVTMPKVLEAYAHARVNFSRRRGVASRAGVENTCRAEVTESEEVPLNGIPRSLHRRVRMEESLAWGEHLVLYQNERAAALKMIGRCWLSNPLSPQPLRVLLRRFMPRAVVSNIVRVKNGRRAAA
jgi:glycosyltransferase involved in cell wall biosynthesis